MDREVWMDRQTNDLGFCLGVFGLGAIIGMALGIVAGILLAPRSGIETRQTVRRNVDRAVNKGRSYVERIRAQNGDGAEEGAES